MTIASLELNGKYLSFLLANVQAKINYKATLPAILMHYRLNNKTPQSDHRADNCPVANQQVSATSELCHRLANIFLPSAVSHCYSPLACFLPDLIPRDLDHREMTGACSLPSRTRQQVGAQFLQ